MFASEYRIEIAVFEKSNGPLTKRIALVDGKIVSDSSSCWLAVGRAHRVEIDGAQAFADLINGFGRHQMYTAGRLKDGLPDDVEVVVKDALNGAANVIARSRDFLVFKEGEPGPALLDVDLKGIPEDTKRRIEERGGMWGALLDVLPALENVARVERASTSSGLRNKETGEPYPGSGGCHIVVLVRDAADVPRFLSDFDARCWLKGYGWGLVSGSGKFLKRSLVDKSCGTPEHPIFEGPPILGPSLVQEGRIARAHDGFVLDTQSLCPPLTNEEKVELQKLIAAEEQRLLPELQAKRKAWSDEHVECLVASGKPLAEARALVDHWLDRQELTGAFPLPFDDAELSGTTVADVLAAPDRYIEKTLSDPFEGPDYGRGKAKLYRLPNGSLFINSFAHGGIRYELKAKPTSDFADLLKKAKGLNKGDEDALKTLIEEMLDASLSRVRRDPITKAAAAALGTTNDEVRALVRHIEAERKRTAQTPKNLAEEHDRLWRNCNAIASRTTLLTDMERVVHDKLGVIGEGAAIRGAYLAATSRLLKRTAISYLRRGAAAAGKNHLVLAVLRLIPEESVIQIASATPQALIYVGEDENDVDALKGKIIVIVEAAILARRANGDEHPMTGMLRILLSEGRLDHRIPVPQSGAAPKTVHIRRDGPVSLFITSAREDIEPEMLTRLLSSDADETGEQTLKIVDRILAADGEIETVSDDEMERWCDLQRWLALNAPYDVAIPFSSAIRQAYRDLVKKNPGTMPLRMRRDVTAFKAAIAASAVLHKVQRKTDPKGRIIAEIADYENAHAAFNDGMAALYDLKPADTIAATLRAVVEITATAPFETDDQGNKSYKITAEDVRKKLGVASKATAMSRLDKLIDLGALEEDTTKHRTGRGSPRFYRPGKKTFDGHVQVNVFAAATDVAKLWRAEGEGTGQTVQDEQEAQVVDITQSSCSVSCSIPRQSCSIPGQQENAPKAATVRVNSPLTQTVQETVQDDEQRDVAISSRYPLRDSLVHPVQSVWTPSPAVPSVPDEENAVLADPSYKVWGSAPPGERCKLCGKAGDVKRIKHGSGVDMWHEDCARDHFEKLANPSVKLPELPPDPLDEHGAPLSLDQRSEAQESRACAQCGAGRPDDQPTIEVEGKHGDRLWVHRECLRFWEKEHPQPKHSIEAPPADAGGAVVNFSAHAGGAAKPSFEVIGPAPLGRRCVVCNIVGLSRQLIRHDGQVDVMHPACAKTALKPKEAP